MSALFSVMTNPVFASIKIQDFAVIPGAFGNASCPSSACEIMIEITQLNALINHFLDINLSTPSYNKVIKHTIILGYIVNSSTLKLFGGLYGLSKIGVMLKLDSSTSLSLFKTFRLVSGPIITFVSWFSCSKLTGVDVSVTRFA